MGSSILLASANSKVCSQLLDTFRVTPESLALLEKNRSAEVWRLEERGRIEEVEIGGRGVGVPKLPSVGMKL